MPVPSSPLRLSCLAVMALGLTLSSVHAETGVDKFRMVASAWGMEDGMIRFFPNFAQALWLNGVRQDTIRDYGAVLLKPGDVFITGSPMIWDRTCHDLIPQNVFYRYRLDRLTSTRAYFTRWAYESIPDHLYSRGTLYRMGALETMDRFQLDITQPYPLEVQDGGDGDFNGVELGNGITARTQ